MRLVFGAMLVCMLQSMQLFGQEGSTSVPGSDGSTMSVEKFDPTRNAALDIQNATFEARRTNKRVLLDVGGEWCIWCRRLDSLYQSHKDLSDYLHSHYVVVKVNYSKENKNEDVLSRYPKIPGYPHLFVLGADGKLLVSQDTGELEKGKGHDPEKVLAFLKRWAASSGNTGAGSR